MNQKKTLSFDELPDFVKEKLQELSERKNVPLEEILELYNELFFDNFVQLDPQFIDDNDRHIYTLRVIKARVLARRPLKKYILIPIGYSEPRKTRSGNIIGYIWVVSVEGGRPKIRRILARNELAGAVNEVQLFNKYEVRLGEMNDGTLVVDSRTRWENPEPIPIGPREFMEKIGIKPIPIAKVEENLSRVGSTGYVDDTDWKAIQGVILRKNIIQRKDGGEFAILQVVDESVPIEKKVLPDGTVVSPGITVFAQASQVKDIMEDSDCIFYGTLEKREDGTYFMSCFLVIPVHVLYTR